MIDTCDKIDILVNQADQTTAVHILQGSICPDRFLLLDGGRTYQLKYIE
ncbi:hypothetical protein [Bacillus sp. Bos-x628]